MNYDYVRYVYQTPIPRFGRDALAKAASGAVERTNRRYSPGQGFAYRVVDTTYSTVIDPDGDVYGSETQIEIIAFPVIKQTDKGFRIDRGGSARHPETRWVSFAWNKQWASLTPEAAVLHFIARKKRQAAIYDARAGKARYAQQLAEACLREFVL